VVIVAGLGRKFSTWWEEVKFRRRYKGALLRFSIGDKKFQMNEVFDIRKRNREPKDALLTLRVQEASKNPKTEGKTVCQGWPTNPHEQRRKIRRLGVDQK